MSYQQGDKVTWFKRVGRVKYEKIPCEFLRYSDSFGYCSIKVLEPGDERVVHRIPVECIERAK
jgi:hypothetical protein